MLAKRFAISGRVQGVGFRYFVYLEVERIGGICGYVRNMRDGSVEVYAEADEHHMNELENTLRKGPRSANVARVEIENEISEGKYTDFRITH